MSKIFVVYWSQTGNTQEMAQAIGQGITESGKTAEVLEVGSVAASDLKEADTFVLGCPAMGAEVLEEMEMEPFVEEVESFSKGKNVGLFGSYGWGDGQWMRDWVERMEQAGANVVNGEGLICQDAPNESALNECVEFGKEIANL